ncbi:hypothetical protein [Bacillus canaveralius]|nr:hypothetical protein [Bacillus canaveralius]
MKKSKLLLSGMVLISWLSIPFLGWNSIKRFLSSSLFISFILMIEAYIGKKRKWWVFFTKINPNVNGELPFILGPFLAGSLWIFKLTYGKFTQYIFVNAIFNIIFAYPLTWLFKKLEIYSLVRIKPYQFFLLMFSKAFLMYGYQSIIEEKKKCIDTIH